MDASPTSSLRDSETEPDYKSRRGHRHALNAQASITPQNLYNIEIRVRNVSTCGFMAECDEVLRIGSFVALDVPGIGQVDAQVRWQLGVRMGGMFLDPISLARCEWTAVRADSTPKAA